MAVTEASAGFDLRTFSLSDMVACGRALRSATREATGLEDAAARVARWLYDHMRTPEGERACVLVRYFQTKPFEALDEEQRAFALGQVQDAIPGPWMKCLALLGTAGDEPAWNDPSQSRGHRVLPLPSQGVVERSPMISRLMSDFGVDVEALTSEADALTYEENRGAFRLFYVGDAHDSPHVPDQDSFVEPYGVRSVLGFGAGLPTGQLFAVILFLRMELDREVAARLQTLALNIKLSMLPFVAGDDTEGYIDAATAELDAIRELLTVHERVVEDQSRHLEGRSRALRALNDAAIAVHAARNVDAVLERLVERARVIVGAARAAATLTIDGDCSQAVGVGRQHSSDGELTDFDATFDSDSREAGVCRTNEARREPGWLAAPLVARDGANLGLIHLSEPLAGDFSEDDEQTLVQLARIGSLALENVRLSELEALEEGERFREELLAGISHDMKTPIVSVVGLAEALLEDDIAMTPEEREAAHGAMLRQARALQGLVLQFLDYTRLEAGRELSVVPRRIDVREVVDEAVGLFEHLRRVEVRTDAPLPEVEADPERLRQIVTNLLSNAVKFSPSSTPVTIELAHLEGEVIVWVVDRGHGLAPEDTLNLFEKFYRGDNTENVSGSGLGLYVSRILAEEMGGRMLVETAPGTGSRFGVALPVADGR